VVFRYRKVNSQRERTMALSPSEFIHRFLQHVLPTGFMKVRYFGFLSPSRSMRGFGTTIVRLMQKCQVMRMELDPSRATLTINISTTAEVLQSNKVCLPQMRQHLDPALSAGHTSAINEPS
jgi:hypothetical protein